MNANLVGKNAESGGSSPRRIARTPLTYSRIWVTGLTIFWPCQFSTVTRCETPSPSTMRPSEYSSIVAAVCAMVAGVRLKIGTTPVPSRIRSVAAAYAISTVSESRPAMWVTYAAS